MIINEENFVDELKKKNEDALYYVIDNYGWILKTVISKHMFKLKSYEQECMNDCLLAIWNNINSFDENRSTFKNWVAGIAKYKSIDYLRKYLKDTENVSIDQVYLQSRKDVLDNLIALEGIQEIVNSISKLGKRDREIFTLLYIDGYSIDEVSEKMKIKKSNIYNILSRGRKKLQKHMDKEKMI